jgi:phosphohistidine phosphatase
MLKFNLWLMRHATAEPWGSKPDEERELTEQGRREAFLQGEALRNAHLPFAAIVSSPLPRAVQTADEVARALYHMGTRRQDDRLAWPDSLDDVIQVAADTAARYVQIDNVMLVGHNPTFGELKARLLNEPDNTQFKKAAVIGFKISWKDGTLVKASHLDDFKKPKV